MKSNLSLSPAGAMCDSKGVNQQKIFDVMKIFPPTNDAESFSFQSHSKREDVFLFSYVYVKHNVEKAKHDVMMMEKVRQCT